MTFKHIPVLYQEVLQGLNLKSGGVYVDGTVGGGGHSKGILESIGPQGRLIAIDQDINALKAAGENLSAYKEQVTFYHANFSQMASILAEAAPEGVDGLSLIHI